MFRKASSCSKSFLKVLVLVLTYIAGFAVILAATFAPSIISLVVLYMLFSIAANLMGVVHTNEQVLGVTIIVFVITNLLRSSTRQTTN